MHVVYRQMKKNEEFFLQKLSCGISRILGKNHIERLRGPIDLAVEIQCNSHESYVESLPESPCGDVSGIDNVPKSECRNTLSSFSRYNNLCRNLMSYLTVKITTLYLNV